MSITLVLAFLQKKSRKNPLAAAAAMAAGKAFKKKCLKASWRQCYYLHRLRDSLSPVCRIFSNKQKDIFSPTASLSDEAALVKLAIALQSLNASKCHLQFVIKA